jgi:hypothetical protein
MSKNDDPSYSKAFSMVEWSKLSLTKVIELPCAASAFSVGLLAATAIGVLRFYRSKCMSSAVNYSVVSFASTATISWELCRFQRREAYKQMASIEQSKILNK